MLAQNDVSVTRLSGGSSADGRNAGWSEVVSGVGAESLLNSAADDTVRRLHNRAKKVASFSGPLLRSRHAVIGYHRLKIADGYSSLPQQELFHRWRCRDVGWQSSTGCLARHDRPV
jgi:hypothetical protein